MFASDLRAALERMDVRTCVDIWRKAFPEMPVPSTQEDAEITMHMARTAASSIDRASRVWSHRWLNERGFPSSLPPEMMPRKPEIVEAVGICVKSVSGNPERVERAARLQSTIAEAVEDAFLGGVRDTSSIRKVIQQIKGA